MQVDRTMFNRVLEFSNEIEKEKATEKGLLKLYLIDFLIKIKEIELADQVKEKGIPVNIYVGCSVSIDLISCLRELTTVLQSEHIEPSSLVIFSWVKSYCK